MLPHFFTQKITRVRPGEKVVRGVPSPDWDNTDELEIDGCSVQPASTSLSQDGRILGVTEGLIAYIPVGADVKAGDKIVYNGEDYSISGEPQVWDHTATGTIDHINLNLQRWDG